ncbi:adenylate/guanylate cyclase domain-containing protein [Marinobacterium arenosum]|uniref:adenylate/guanylate cyclase domain-containing protein n=1 Tax=Marinobacterium arenosum TaxID=2862496 RepID=UPI001C93C5C9|nr:adenylate/guanylate cyclase domain-containing protein [Marinobacterium arenosum]MBY4676683.1 AAA family ATPase [Marinobacterium arenosum]
MRCTSCGVENPGDAKFCNQCGTPLPLTCAKCGNPIRPAARYCDSCGMPVGEGRPSTGTSEASQIAPIQYTPPHLAERILAEQASLQAKGALTGERKIITALFADIAGSTALVEGLDPEDARGLIDPVLSLMMDAVLSLMMDAVHHYEGYVAKSLGDGILALFGSPIAHEDHPQRALYAALRMQQAVGDYSDQVLRQHGCNLQIRVGIHTGEVVVRAIHTEDLHIDYDPVGPPIHLASRMEGIAGPGTVLVSEATWRLVQGYFEFKPLGRKAVKGLSDPIAVYQLQGLGSLRTRLQISARHGLARFIGRERELQQLDRALERAMHYHGQVIGVVGEPGVGKSRLFHEFKHRARSSSLVLETFSISHGKAFAYLPLIELLKQYFQFSPPDSETARREKIQARAQALDGALADTLPYLFHLLGIGEPDAELSALEPQYKRQRIFEAIRQWLERECASRPVVLIMEDLQWLDGESQAFLDYLVPNIGGIRLLLLVNYRPEYRHNWDHYQHYSHLRLEPFGQREAEAMLDTLLGQDTTLKPLKPIIHQQTGGNPFFLEELVQTLVEEEALSGSPGHYRLQRPLTELPPPTTVQGVLSARIDRLDAADKDLLQTVAVIGKAFPWSLVKQVVDLPEDDLHRRMSRLQDGEFLYQRAAFPEIEFNFKHGLTQEVAYGSLLRERRAELHERAARAIEALYPQQLNDHCKELAHHYCSSGNHPKALEYLGRAGQQAMYQSATAEAIDHFSAALKVLDQLPAGQQRDRDELGIQLDLGPAWIAVNGYAEPGVEKIYNRALALCRQVGDNRQLFPILLGLRNFYHVRGELLKARELAEQLLTLANTEQDTSLKLEALRALGSSSFNRGELRSALSHFEQARKLYDRNKHQKHVFRYGLDPGVFTLGYQGWVLWMLGYPEQALQRSQQMLRLARELEYPFVLAYALVLMAELDLHLHQGRDAEQHAAAAIALANEYGYHFWGAWATVLQGAGQAQQARYNEGIAKIRQGLDAFQATGAELWQSHFRTLLAEALATDGRITEGMEALSEARHAIASSGELTYAAEVERIEGELVLAQPDGKVANRERSAQACFEKAIATARQQQARSLELRAVLSLCRLWRTQGHKKEACELLASRYDAFTEGTDTADLLTAQELLTELR